MDKQIFQKILLLIFFMAACSPTSPEEEPTETYDPNANMEKITIQQGVWGNIWFWEGDFMPVKPSGTIYPVVRQVFIHDLTTDTSVVYSKNSVRFIDEINTKLVRKTTSDESGFFQANLLPGKYSFFIKEGSAYYAGLWDGQGNIHPFTVAADSLTKINFDITYRATF